MGTKYSIGAVYSDGKKTKCKWKGCKPNTHDTRIKYPKGGVVWRDKYTGAWAHPFAMFPQKSQKSYHLVFVKKFGKKIRTYPTTYLKRNHHVIPVNKMTKVLKTIAHNLELLTWDMNDGVSNGMCLPFNNEDIKWHDLQAHRGSHGKYDDLVESSLNDLETECEKFCSINKQDKLLAEIAEKVIEFRENIANWSWKLHHGSDIYR